MRFEKNWDQMLLDTWDDCNNKQAVLTCYPPGYTLPNEITGKSIFGMGAEKFNEEGVLLMRGRPAYTFDKLPDEPLEGAFLSGCMFFGPAPYN